MLFNRHLLSSISTSFSKQIVSKRFNFLSPTTATTTTFVPRSSLSTLTTNNFKPQPPTSINKEIAFGIQNTTQMYLKYGVSHEKLMDIAKESGEKETLVTRWQRMMETFLSTQVHVISGLGYVPNESGLQLYTQHVAMYMQTCDPTTQEELRIITRDIWRYVLTTTFNISNDEIKNNELSIVDARNVMHKVAQRMQEPEILEKVSQKCSTLESSGDVTMDTAMKHHIIQDALVYDVYLGGTPSLVEECGFEDGEKGYVFMQYLISEHQNDPLIGQYIGSSMMRLCDAAGIDMTAIQKAAEAMNTK